MINGFWAPFREDRNDKGGGLLPFLKDHVPCRIIIIDFSPQLEAIVVERIWLLIGCYIQDCLNSIGNELNELSIKYENIIMLGDFNSEMCEDAMQVFYSTYSFNSLVKDPTCFKSSSNPSCIDLILTNKSRCFQNTSVIETGLSNFHK